MTDFEAVIDFEEGDLDQEPEEWDEWYDWFWIDCGGDCDDCN